MSRICEYNKGKMFPILENHYEAKLPTTHHQFAAALSKISSMAISPSAVRRGVITMGGRLFFLFSLCVAGLSRTSITRPSYIVSRDSGTMSMERHGLSLLLPFWIN